MFRRDLLKAGLLTLLGFRVARAEKAPIDPPKPKPLPKAPNRSFHLVPIAKLKQRPAIKGYDAGADALERLILSIRQDGQVNPILIDQHFKVIDGAYRVTAMLRLGYTQIWAQVIQVD